MDKNLKKKEQETFQILSAINFHILEGTLLTALLPFNSTFQGAGPAEHGGQLKEFFRTCNVLPFSCTHLVLWRGKRQGKRPQVTCKTKRIKEFLYI